MTPNLPPRLALAALLVALAAPGCTPLLNPDPLNKTESIVNGTQVTRGPSRGFRGGGDSGFASTAAPSGNTFGAVAGNGFDPAVGEPFAIEELGGLSSADVNLPELQGIDFGTEQAYVSEIASSGIIPADGSASSYFLTDIGQSVYFDTNSSELNERSRETLRRQAAWLNINTGARVSVEGHADERGTREYNLALGDRRASATRGYLIAVGVDESRIDKTSYGKERPVALGSDPQAWAQNRRTETVLDDAGSAFTSNPLASEPMLSEPLGGTISSPSYLSDPLVQTTFGTDPFASDPFPITTTDPLFPAPATDTLGVITYDSQPTSTLSSGIIGQTQTFDSGTIAPTVFDTGTVAPPPYGMMVPVPTTTVTTGTRIEDVSVDDLLRDPSLIDRIGTPGTTTTPAS